MKAGLSFITLLAFDYRYSFDAIASYYAIADEVILGLDESRLSWAGHPFEIDLNEMRTFIERIDTAGKIRLVEGNFHADDHPMTNDTQERNALSHLCAPLNWVVQIDSDEMMLDPAGFAEWMNGPGSAAGDAAVAATWITIFKTFGPQVLVISPMTEVVPIATRARGRYVHARWTRQPLVVSPLKLLHYSWGRTAEELQEKLRNWGHSRDFDTDAFYRRWDGLSLENYSQWRDFHPLEARRWQSLSLATIQRDGRPS